MKRYWILFTLLMLLGYTQDTAAQDIIYCQDGSVLKAEIERVDTVNVYYYLYPKDHYTSLFSKPLSTIDSLHFDHSFNTHSLEIPFEDEIQTRHAVAAEVSGSMLGIGVGYSGILAGRKHVLFTGGIAVGFSPFPGIATKGDLSICLTDKSKPVTGSYLEMGMMGTWIAPVGPFATSEGTFTPFYVGYRYQPIHSGVHVRVNGGIMFGNFGFLPFIPTINLSIGGAF